MYFSIYIYRYAYAFRRLVQQQVKSHSGLSARSTFLQRRLFMLAHCAAVRLVAHGTSVEENEVI